MSDSLGAAVGIDIGGTGIKGALVDLDNGDLLSERIKVDTPEGGKPKDIIDVVTELVGELEPNGQGPVGVCFPAVVHSGKTMSAANVSKKWIGLEADAKFTEAIGRRVFRVNDADAAGYAEAAFGAAKNVHGLAIMTTLGTGIGSAFIYDGVLIPNTELGHLEIDGTDAEKTAAFSAKEREDLSWEDWAVRLQRYYSFVEALFSPDKFIVGGGVSKSYDKFLPLLELQTEIVPAQFRNNAGIMGAAALTTRKA